MFTPTCKLVVEILCENQRVADLLKDAVYDLVFDQGVAFQVSISKREVQDV